MKKIDIKGIAIKSGCLGVGAYASVKINKVDFIAKQKPALRGAIKLVIGAFAPVLIGQKTKKGASEITSIGDGMIALGVIEIATAFDKDLANDISTQMAGIGNLSTMGEIIFDESYSGVGATNDVMGATEGTGGYNVEM